MTLKRLIHYLRCWDWYSWGVRPENPCIGLLFYHWGNKHEKLKPTLRYHWALETSLPTEGQKASGCASSKFILYNNIGYMQILSEGEKKKKTQQKWIFIYQAWAMETNSHLCISNSLHTGGWAHQGLCISQQAVLGEKILYTGRSKLHLSCFLEGAEYHKSFQAKSSSDVNQHFPDKIGGPTFNFSCYVCGCTRLL